MPRLPKCPSLTGQPRAQSEYFSDPWEAQVRRNYLRSVGQYATVIPTSFWLQIGPRRVPVLAEVRIGTATPGACWSPPQMSDLAMTRILSKLVTPSVSTGRRRRGKKHR